MAPTPTELSLGSKAIIINMAEYSKTKQGARSLHYNGFQYTINTKHHVEGWHNKINRAAGKGHPNIFELVELFKTEQANTEVCLAQ